MTHDSTNFSRRDFVKSAAAAAVVVPGLTSTFSIARTANVRGADTIKIGIIGCGGRGTGAAVQALNADKGSVLHAMGDLFADRVDTAHAAITEEMGDDAAQRIQATPERRFVGLDAYKQVIDSGVDVVLLTTYPCFRPAHLKAAIDAGKHVFAEKPLAVDGPGVRSVLESAAAAKRKNLAILVGFCWRHHPGMRAAFEHVHSGAIGDLTTVQTTYYTGTLSKRPRKPEWSDLEFQMRNWWHFTWISGDHIVEQAVHSIDRLAWAMKDQSPVRAISLGGRAARSGPEHGNVFDHFSVVYEYADGRRAFHACRQIDGCPSDNTDYLYGTRGSAIIEGWTPRLECRNVAGDVTWRGTGTADDAGRMYQLEHDALFESIRGGGRPINDCERSANSTLMAILGRMAAYTGQTISWEQAMGSKETLVPEVLAWDRPMATPTVAVPGVTKFV